MEFPKYIYNTFQFFWRSLKGFSTCWKFPQNFFLKFLSKIVYSLECRSPVISKYVNIYQNFCAPFKKWPSSFATQACKDHLTKMIIKIRSKLSIIHRKSTKIQNPQTCVENFQNPQVCGEIRKFGNTETDAFAPLVSELAGHYINLLVIQKLTLIWNLGKFI